MSTMADTVTYAREHSVAVSWAQISAITSQMPSESVYDWCWVCGMPLGPDKMHVMIDNGRLPRHTYCCRKHRYVKVDVGLREPMLQTRSDYEIESLSMAFKSGALKPGWE